MIGVSKSPKNSSALGITGRIREAFDYPTTKSDDPMIFPTGEYGFAANIDFAMFRSLEQYQNSVKESISKKEKWDEFERSISVKFVDDVLVSVKEKRYDNNQEKFLIIL